jgi:hypothetical protein
MIEQIQSKTIIVSVPFGCAVEVVASEARCNCQIVICRQMHTELPKTGAYGNNRGT